MMKEIMGAYAESFKEADWLVRIQHLYLLVVPVLLGGLTLYLSTKW